MPIMSMNIQSCTSNVCIIKFAFTTVNDQSNLIHVVIMVNVEIAQRLSVLSTGRTEFLPFCVFP